MTGTVLNNPAHLAMNWPGQVRAGLWLNVCNSLTVQALTMPYMPSPELTAAAIRALPGEKELLVYGRIPLMLLRHCPLNHVLEGGLHAACRRCDRVREGIEAHELIDRKEASFPFTRLKTGSGCILTLHNSVPLMLLRHSGRIPRRPAGAYCSATKRRNCAGTWWNATGRYWMGKNHRAQLGTG